MCILAVRKDYLQGALFLMVVARADTDTAPFEGVRCGKKASKELRADGREAERKELLYITAERRQPCRGGSKRGSRLPSRSLAVTFKSTVYSH